MAVNRILMSLLGALALPLPALAQSVPIPGFPEPGATSPAARSQPAAPKSSAAAQPKAPAAPVAKIAFGAMRTPAPLAARAIGAYAKGCLAGARPLPIDGPTWQAMRLSRNRNWGHPELIALVERFASEARQDGWPGLLVGDISQPRGGPMLTGHASHQVGLDADVWLTPMPPRRLSEQEREDLAATSMLGADQLAVDPKVWTQTHLKLIKRAASYAQVERVLVHPAIKKALCLGAGAPHGADRAWLAKVRPYWGHHYHMHIRIGCPKDSAGCVPQKPTDGDDGCGKEVESWLALIAAPPKPGPAEPPKPPMTVDQLPAECRIVLDSGKPSAVARMRPRPAASNATAQ